MGKEGEGYRRGSPQGGKRAMTRLVRVAHSNTAPCVPSPAGPPSQQRGRFQPSPPEECDRPEESERRVQ